MTSAGEVSPAVQVIFSKQWPRTNALGLRVGLRWVSIINSSELPLECKHQVSNSLGSICCAECLPQKVAGDTLTLSERVECDFCRISFRRLRRPAADLTYLSLISSWIMFPLQPPDSKEITHNNFLFLHEWHFWKGGIAADKTNILTHLI